MVLLILKKSLVDTSEVQETLKNIEEMFIILRYLIQSHNDSLMDGTEINRKSNAEELCGLLKRGNHLSLISLYLTYDFQSGRCIQTRRAGLVIQNDMEYGNIYLSQIN